ncbi:MAG: glycosyltransferase family 2 protein [Planctomycetota bacterium]
MRIAVIIPARDEEASVGRVLAAIPHELAADLIVVDNGSRDATAEVARRAGARVVHEERPGYGSACLAGIAALEPCDIVVFLDADYSDYPEEMTRLVAPLLEGRADLVIGSRTLGKRESGALLPQARCGNWLACQLIRWLFGQRMTDLGPFRAIRRSSLQELDMADRTFGWTVEMQVKAVQHGLRVVEVPVSYRRRVGKSKITGTVWGTVRAGWKIVTTILRLRFGRRSGARRRVGGQG